jgi:hypothetical protein
MSGPVGPFRPDELLGSDGPIRESDQAAALASARELEQSLPPDAVRPSADFTTRVMAAIAVEPVPRPVGFLAALWARPNPRGFIASLRQAWAIASGGLGRPMAARSAALAYVLVVAILGLSLTGVAAVGAASALHVFGPDRTAPPIVSPSPTPSPEPTDDLSGPTESAEPGESPEPSGTEEASESPEPSETGGGGSPGPVKTPRPSAAPSPTPGHTDDNGGSETPEPSDDHGGGSGGSGSPSQSPKPSATP